MAQKKQKQGKRTPAYSTDTMVVCLVVGLLLIALGVLIFLGNALNMTGDVFDGLRVFSRGMCGALCLLLAVIPAWGGVLVLMSIQRKPPMRPFLLAILLLVLMCTAATLLTFVAAPPCWIISNRPFSRWAEQIHCPPISPAPLISAAAGPLAAD